MKVLLIECNEKHKRVEILEEVIQLSKEAQLELLENERKELQGIRNRLQAVATEKALSGTKKNKGCFHLYFAGYPLVLRFKHFTTEELDWIENLLKEKSNDPVGANA
jgi:hypothetical protein